MATVGGTLILNAVSFNHLFLQIVAFAIRKCKVPHPEVKSFDNEAAFYQIEQLGFTTGQKLIERILLSANSPQLSDQLECVKFICKEYWISIFGKAIDNLKTNHRGIFVMLDSSFPWVSRFAVDANVPETAKMAILYLAFPCGLIRGALASMGIVCSVTAEIPEFPQTIFQIRASSVPISPKDS